MSTQFLFLNTREEVLRICTILIFLDGSYEHMDIFREFQLSSGWGGESICAHNRYIDSKLLFLGDKYKLSRVPKQLYEIKRQKRGK